MKNKVAIFIPMYKKKLEDYEKVSLEFLERNLKCYDKFIIIPEFFDVNDLPFDISKFNFKRFNDNFFTSIKSFNHLLMSNRFYEQFKDYDYILSYQPDCLVFEDKLDYFCSLGYDYIGAPFIENSLREVKDLNKIMVGNGGFSLRKVSSFIKTIELHEKENSTNNWFLRYFFSNFFHNIGGFVKKIIKVILLGQGEMSSIFSINEDVFWSEGAKQYNPSFKVAPPKIALSFSFENNVQLCFKLNNNLLPFGCHAFQCKKNLMNWEKLGVECSDFASDTKVI